MKYQEISKLILEDQPLAHSLLDFFIGDELGLGATRTVCDFKLDWDYVLKIEHSGAEGDNWAEWRIWKSVEHCTNGLEKWFAPCHWISPCGRIMLQRKTKPLMTRKSKIPEKIPSFFTDIKEENFGWLGTTLVCHDYSYCIERLGYIGLKLNKLQKFKI